jgi:hypothetical protein
MKKLACNYRQASNSNSRLYFEGFDIRFRHRAASFLLIMDDYSFDDAISDSKLIASEYHDFSVYSLKSDDQLIDCMKTIRSLDFSISLLCQTIGLMDNHDDVVSDEYKNRGDILITQLSLADSRQTILLRDDDFEYLGIPRYLPATIDRKQLQKDMERDQLLVNGTLLIGAVHHLSGIVDSCTATMSKLLLETGFSAYSNTSKLGQFAMHCLSRSARTQSGSAAFNLIRSIVPPDDFDIMPLSQYASPLLLRFYVEPLIGDYGVSVLSCCQVECSTVFCLQPTNIDEKSINIKVTFLDTISLNVIEKEEKVPHTRGTRMRIEPFPLAAKIK